MIKTCDFPGCGRPHSARGKCQSHAKQLREGRELSELATRVPRSGSCKIDGCLREVHQTGECIAHYSRRVNGRDMNAPIRPRASGKDQCSGPDCERVATHSGYCSTHSWQLWKYGEGNLRIIRERNPAECGFPACETISIYGGLCARHARYARTFGLSDERFIEIASAGVCDACGVAGEYKKGGLAIDHDHSCCPESAASCGKCVRGLLCSGCNWALGNVGDSRDRLRKLVEYLDRANV